MKKLMQRGAAVLLALVSVFAVGFGVVQAQNNNPGPANGFVVAPVRWPITIEKGKSDQTLTISVTNPSSSPLIARPVVNDFIASADETGEPRLILDDSTPAPSKSFKTLVGPLDEITLGPNEKKNIPVTISVPADARSGGYYGAIRFVPQNPPNTSQTNVGLTASVGTIVLVRVPGNLKEQLSLVQMSAAIDTKQGKDTFKAKSFFTSGEVAMLTRLKNTGDIHVAPIGRITIKNIFGKKVHEFEFNQPDSLGNRALVLPDSTRKYNNELKGKKWFGRYTIEANFGYGTGGGGTLQGKANFWYIPTLALYLIIALVLAAVAAVYWLIRKHKARKHHKHEVNKVKL